MNFKNIKTIKKRISLIVAALCVGWIINISDSVFADGASLVLSPMSQKIILTPGETYQGAVDVLNASGATADLEFEASVGSYNPTKNDESKDDYGGVDVVQKSNYNIMLDWTTIDRESGILAPNEKTTITYTIKVPETAPAGAQYMSILVSQKDDDTNVVNSSSVKSKFQLASIIYANVAGETIEKGSIKENSMPTILTTNTLEATSMVRNDGNIYTDASYTLQVWPMFSDEEICTNEESAESSLVLPNTERYHVQTCNLPMVGIFKAKQVVSIFGEQSVLEKTIFVCPIWLMILVLVIVIAIIIAIIIIIKKHSKKAED